MLLGIHVTKSSHVLDDKTTESTMSQSIIRDLNELKLNSAQIFTHGPKFIVANKVDYEEVEKISKNINLSVHSAYPTVSIWKIKSDVSTDDKKTIDKINQQLIACKKIGAWGLVLHVTKIKPETVFRVMNILKPYAISSGVKIVIEMVSSKADPNTTYETPEKINNLTNMLEEKNESDWWGWCVDTAHLWGAGVDVKSYENMSTWLNNIEYKNKIVMFHLNGSSVVRGSGKDKHEIVFSKYDKIWSKCAPMKSGAAAVVEFAKMYKIPMICEINRGSEKEVKTSISKLKNIYKLFN